MRYFIAALVVLFFVIVGVVLFVGRDRPVNTPVATNDVAVAEYTDKATSRVVWTQQGSVVGNNERYSVRISVSPQNRKIELLQGYDQKVVKSKNYSNNKDAYRVFLKSLKNLGFGEVRDRVIDDEEGVCPTGRRYIYELYEGAEKRLYSWSTSCTTDHGTFDGVAASVIRKLFKDQATDYKAFVSGIRF